MCKNVNNPEIQEPCCFEMGVVKRSTLSSVKAGSEQPKIDDLDPSLAYDVSAYGHLGFDPNLVQQ